MNLRPLARKPLVHFMLAGAVLSGLQTLSGGRAPAAPAAVVVTAARVEALAADWRRATGRHPSEDELERAIEDWVDRELLFRAALDQGLQRSDALVQRRLIQNQRFLEDREDGEDETGRLDDLDDAKLLERAFALGLERSDPVVRRRLIERMRSILLAAAPAAPPPPSALSQEPTAVPWTRLTQVPLTRDRHGAGLSRAARSLLEQLRSEGLGPDDPALEVLGDPLLIPRLLSRTDAPGLTRRFGPDFADAALRAPERRWSGPVPSSYGLHLVWIHERGSWQAEPPAHESAAATLPKGQQASLRRGLQILRQDVDVIRYDRPRSPRP